MRIGPLTSSSGSGKETRPSFGRPGISSCSPTNSRVNILTSIPNTELNGHKTLRLANTSNVTFDGIESEALLILLDQEGVCASSGSACLADSGEPSHVVKAMKPEAGASRQMIRFSLDAATNLQDISAALAAVLRAAAMLRPDLLPA